MNAELRQHAKKKDELAASLRASLVGLTRPYQATFSRERNRRIEARKATLAATLSGGEIAQLTAQLGTTSGRLKG
ncbi:MAG: hypothetical protein WB586_06065 [Chthoniobacterales bacterium]